MKRFLISISTLLISVLSFAGNWNIDKPEDAIGKDVVFYDIESMFQSYKAFAYTAVDGKLKIVKDAQFYSDWNSNPCNVIGVPVIGDKKLIEVVRDGKTYYFKYIDGHRYLIKDVTAIKEAFARNRDSRNYIRKGEKWLPCTWTGVIIPTLYQKDVVFKVEIDGKDDILLAANVEDNAADFISESEYQRIEAEAAAAVAREKAMADSVAALSRTADSLARAAAVAAAVKEAALDSAVTAKMNRFCEARQIVFVKNEYTKNAAGDFGYDVNVFNYHDIAIRYIEITLTAFNEEDVALKMQAVRCEGPVEPGKIAYYSFEDMFCASMNPVSVEMTYVLVKLEDGTSIKYTTRESVARHCLPLASYETIGLSEEESDWWRKQME